MKEFDVTITETLKLTVSVEASSKEEARQMVSDQWHAGDHILDADNFVEVEFESNDGREISAERAQDDTIEVLMVEPGQYPRVERIGSDLASLQKAVDGYIEAIYPYDDPVALICGEEAKLEGKPLNRALRDEDGDIYDTRRNGLNLRLERLQMRQHGGTVLRFGGAFKLICRVFLERRRQCIRVPRLKEHKVFRR